MSDPQTYGDSPNAISSPGSADGHSHYDSPESRRLRAAGRAVRRASHLVWLENKSGSKIPVTWLQPFSTLSQSLILQSYLGSRLETLLGYTGSILYSWTWRQKVTSAGLPYCQQAVRARPPARPNCLWRRGRRPQRGITKAVTRVGGCATGNSRPIPSMWRRSWHPILRPWQLTRRR